MAVVADTGEDEAVLAAVRSVVEQLGAIDILVNAAATPATGAPLREEDLEHEINVKVRGYLRCIRAVAPLMVERGWGRIINVSGLAARQTGSITGSIRNVAVAAMTKNLADELGPKGINVTVVHPGMTITEGSPERFRAMAAALGRDPDAIEAETRLARLDRPDGARRRGRRRDRVPRQPAQRRAQRRRDRRERRSARRDSLLRRRRPPRAVAPDWPPVPAGRRDDR